MNDKTPYKVIAAIPALNEEPYIESLVLNLVEQSQTLPMQIIVADGGSTDKTREIVGRLSEQYDNVFLLPNPKKTQSAGVNLAVETYGDNAPYLIRHDAHADYPEDFCQSLIDDAENVNADAVVVSMHTVGEGWFQRATAAAQNSKLGNGGSSHRIIGEEGRWVDHGHHALMRVEAYRNAGGYDEDFPQNQDAELDIRLDKAGYKIWLTGNTSMTYYPRSALLPLFKQYYKFGRGRLKTILKHKIRPHLRQILPVAVAPAAVIAVLSPIWGGFALPLSVWAGLCLIYGLILGVKERDPIIALTGPLAMVMHFAWSLGFWKGIFEAILAKRA